MQNTSIVVFFLLLHIPLTKVNAAFSFLTGFTVWFLDNKTKASIYHACGFVTRALCDPKGSYKQWKKSHAKLSFLDTGRASIMNKGHMSKKDRIKMKALVDWVCLNVFIFSAILLNYIYTTLLHDFTVGATTALIIMLDKAGFEAHFIRFIHMTMFAQDGISEQEQLHTVSQLFEIVSYDPFLLALILMLFLATMHFFTAPMRRRYTHKFQLLIGPLAFIPCFMWSNIDVLILSIFLLIQFGYIAWFMIDQEEFGAMNYAEDYEHEDDDDYGQSVHGYRNSQNNNDSSWLETVQEAFIGLGAAFDFSGTQAMANMTR